MGHNAAHARLEREGEIGLEHAVVYAGSVYGYEHGYPNGYGISRKQEKSTDCAVLNCDGLEGGTQGSGVTQIDMTAGNVPGYE